MQTNSEETTTVPAPGEYRIYVGTYAKYNNGSIEGAWLDLEDYADKDEFYEACKKLHSDESDPEFMFQDHEGIPDSYISECSIEAEFWTDYLSLDDDDRVMLRLYRENVNQDADLQEAQDAFSGAWSSLEDYVIDYWESCGEYQRDDRNWWSPINYVDWEKMAHDLETSGDVTAVEHNGSVYVFSNH